MQSDEYLFEPVKSGSVVDSVTQQIEDLIISGVLKEGAKLPSEREIAEVMEVSRPKVREALKRLEENQLILIRHGEGSFIAPLMNDAMTPALINLIARNKSVFFDYLEYRREQEGLAAQLAAERATRLDRQRIEFFLNKLQYAHENGDTEVSKEADIGFHSAIVDASHNVLLVHVMTSIYELTRKGVFYSRDFLRSIDGTGEKLLKQHQAIGAAILDRDPVKAKAAALAHLDFVESSFRLWRAQIKREHISSKRLASLGAKA